MGDPRGRAYAGGGCGSGAERDGASCATAGEPSCSGARPTCLAAGVCVVPPLACLRLEVVSLWLAPAGVAVEGSVGGSVGDSGSHTGRGGVAARGGACLYCALKDVTLFIVAGCAEGGCFAKESLTEVRSV